MTLHRILNVPLEIFVANRQKGFIFCFFSALKCRSTAEIFEKTFDLEKFIHLLHSLEIFKAKFPQGVRHIDETTQVANRIEFYTALVPRVLRGLCACPRNLKS
jgi:hypothetical protein